MISLLASFSAGVLAGMLFAALLVTALLVTADDSDDWPEL